jgi:hypothetical protein
LQLRRKYEQVEEKKEETFKERARKRKRDN